MALLAPEPPHQAAEAVQSTFRAFAENRTFRSPALRSAAGPLRLTEPQEVFTLGLADLVAGRGLEAARSTGWRYLVQEGDNVLAAAETVTTAANTSSPPSTKAASSPPARRRSEWLGRFPR